MRQKMLHIIRCATAFFTCLFMLVSVSATCAHEDVLELANEYIRIVVNTGEFNTGRFSVGTTYGDPDNPNDQFQQLIYGVNEPWTSYTTVRISDENWVFGGETNRRAGRDGLYGIPLQDPVLDGESITTQWQLGPLEVSQNLSFARSSTTGLIDTARIEYELHNADVRPHSVGLRVVLDTMLGENDGAPFRVEEDAILTDTMYTSDTIPEFFQAFDSLSDPQVMSQGTLLGGEVTRPDRVYFTNWGVLADELWNFSFRPGRDFTRLGEFELDSALALFWEEKLLDPGQTISVVAYYGLGGVTIAPGDLSLGVTSPSQVTADPIRKHSFPIIAYIQNTGEGEARDVVARISLPEGLELVDGQAERELGNLAVNDTLQTSWQAAPTGEIKGSMAFSVFVDAINSEANEVRRTIEVLHPAVLELHLEGRKALSIIDEQLVPNPVPVQAFIRNVGGSEAFNVLATLETPIGLGLTRGERRTKYPGILVPGEEVTVLWYIEPLGASGNLPYTLRVSHAAGDSAKNEFLEVPNLERRIWLSEPQLSKDGPIVAGDHFSVSVWATNIPNLERAELDISFNSEVVQVVGRALDVSLGTLFVDRSQTPAIPLQWTPPQVDNVDGSLTGFVGDRGGTPSDRVLSFGTLMTIHFFAKAPGDAEIRIRRAEIENVDGNSIKVDIKERDVTIQ